MRRAISLVEVIVVIAIMAVLLLLLPAIQQVRDVELKARCESNLRRIRVALQQLKILQDKTDAGNANRRASFADGAKLEIPSQNEIFPVRIASGAAASVRGLTFQVVPSTSERVYWSCITSRGGETTADE